MLAGLARWLRAAGHDVVILPPGTPDAALIGEARRAGRVLITRDRDLASGAAHPGVVALGTDDIDRQAAELTRRLGLDGLAVPFTRCLVDNAELVAAQTERIPEGARTRGGPFRRRPACGRVYRPGSHVRRMGGAPGGMGGPGRRESTAMR